VSSDQGRSDAENLDVDAENTEYVKHCIEFDVHELRLYIGRSGPMDDLVITETQWNNGRRAEDALAASQSQFCLKTL